MGASADTVGVETSVTDDVRTEASVTSACRLLDDVAEAVLARPGGCGGFAASTNEWMSTLAIVAGPSASSDHWPLCCQFLIADLL